METSWLLWLSALGVYFHAIFVSITLGFPLIIMALLLKYNKTGDQDYLRSAKVLTAILAINFALGAITGTLVEFGLVQAWPGTIVAIASFAFVPLALELLAFANEIAFLILFIVTLGKIRPILSFTILLIYWIFAVFSGLLITSVNSWLVAPWGTGELAKAIYPFMPEYGPNVVDVQKLLALKVLSLATGAPIQAIIQNPQIAEKVGVILYDPYIAFSSPFVVVSILHNLSAALIVGISIALAFYAFRFYRTHEERYLKVVKVSASIIFVLFLIQPTVFGHFMGEGVVKFNPTKFAMMENARETYNNPIVALVAYGDPSKPIIGFNDFRKSCENLGNLKLGELVESSGLSLESVRAISKEIGISVDPGRLEKVWEIEVKKICIADVEKAMEKIGIIHFSYYTKISFGIIGFISSIALFLHIKGFSPVSSLINKLLKNRSILILSILVFLGSAIPSALGWYVRELGRKPWTVYGLLYPEEVVTVVSYARTAEFAILFGLLILAIAIFGILAMFLIAIKEFKFER